MIGIIGGMGPMAGVRLAETLITNTPVSRDQDHLPFVLHSLPNDVPDRTDYLLGNVEENPANKISNIILQQESIGVRYAVVACNTSHSPEIFDSIVEQLRLADSKITLISIIEEVMKYLSELNKKSSREIKVGVLSTKGSNIIRLYERRLEQSNIEVIDLPSELVDTVHDAIYDKDNGLKALSYCSVESMDKINLAIDYFVKEVVTHIILGCTELPICISKK